MSPHAEFLADHPTDAVVSTVPAVYGRRAASVLGGALLLALALVTFGRWTGGDASTLEKAVQQPVPADLTTSSPRADLTAPDPGDDPP